MTTLEMLKNTKSAWRDLSTRSTDEKNKILLSMADFLQKNCEKTLDKIKIICYIFIPNNLRG